MQHRLPVAFLAAMAFLASTLAYSATVVLPDFTVLVEQQSPSVVKISTVASRMTNSQGQTQEDIPELFRYFFGDARIAIGRAAHIQFLEDHTLIHLLTVHFAHLLD